MEAEEFADQDILQACIRKDKQAWEQFVEKYTNLVYHTIQKILRIYNPVKIYLQNYMP
jgi:hypothetical protein